MPLSPAPSSSHHAAIPHLLLQHDTNFTCCTHTVSVIWIQNVQNLEVWNHAPDQNSSASKPDMYKGTDPELRAHTSQALHRRLLASVSAWPMTISPRRARVIATFMRRASDRNPSRPCVLLRTVLNTITSFSRPWNPSIVLTSNCSPPRFTLMPPSSFSGNFSMPRRASPGNRRMTSRFCSEARMSAPG